MVHRALLLVALALPAFPQRADVAILGGGGFSRGEESASHNIAGFGATAGWPYSSRHRLQGDYLYLRSYNDFLPERRHLITGSYVVQGKAGRALPFFQVGAGVVVQTFDAFQIGTPPFTRTVQPATDSSIALVLGAGATVDIGRNLFVRPQLRMYGYVGPTVSFLPSVAFGWRF